MLNKICLPSNPYKRIKQIVHPAMARLATALVIISLLTPWALFAAPAAPAQAAPIEDTAAEMLQFTSGGHVLGFTPDKMYVSNGTYALRVEFVQANGVTPQAPAGGAVEGGAAPALAQVTYPNLWPGISLAYDAGEGIARSTYTLAPGANPAAIRLRYNAPLQIEADGSLRIAFETGQMRESAPLAWQEIDGTRVPVEIAFHLVEQSIVNPKSTGGF
jgi:hypothetical protein